MNQETLRKNKIQIAKLPKCDNCGKAIITFGKYVWIRGIYCYVHKTFNEKTTVCESEITFQFAWYIMPFDQCVRCYRKAPLVKIGLVILMKQDGETSKVKVCNPHIDKIKDWLNLSTNPMIKLPKSSLSKDEQRKLF